MFRTYPLAPETVQRILRRAFWRFQLLVTITFLVFGLYLAFFAGPVNWQIAGPMTGVIALAYFLIIFFHYRSQLRLLYSVRYELDGSSIIYRQVGQDPLRVMRADILAVEQRKDGLLILTVDGEQHILIPYGLARGGDSDLLNTLVAWVGINAVDSRAPAPVGRLVVFGAVGAMAILLFANSLLATLVLGVLVVGFGLYNERRLLRLQEATPGVVQMHNMAFSFLVFMLVMKSCLITMSMAMAMSR